MDSEVHLMFRLRLYGITKQGLIGLGLAVFALWGCFASERITTHRAQDELRTSLRRIARLRASPLNNSSPNSQPASRPTPGTLASRPNAA